ncbi:hypothetical protein ABIB06_002485, partial [Bradyrhizobium sp. LB8.2]|uniref:hypothetical protein n=1 Tax=unclassified Bradyrhizobium TaxID=2631580 RepID=UPI003398062D
TDGSFLLLPQVILEMSLSPQLPCLIPGVQSSAVFVFPEFGQTAWPPVMESGLKRLPIHADGSGLSDHGKS